MEMYIWNQEHTSHSFSFILDDVVPDLHLLVKRKKVLHKQHCQIDFIQDDLGNK